MSDPEHHPQQRVAPVGPSPTTPEIRTTPLSRMGIARSADRDAPPVTTKRRRRRRPLGDWPAPCPTRRRRTRWHSATPPGRRRRTPRRWPPGQPIASPWTRAICPVLPIGEHPEDGKCVEAAKTPLAYRSERDENPGEGDAHSPRPHRAGGADQSARVGRRLGRGRFGLHPARYGIGVDTARDRRVLRLSPNLPQFWLSGLIDTPSHPTTVRRVQVAARVTRTSSWLRGLPDTPVTQERLDRFMNLRDTVVRQTTQSRKIGLGARLSSLSLGAHGGPAAVSASSDGGRHVEAVGSPDPIWIDDQVHLPSGGGAPTEKFGDSLPIDAVKIPCRSQPRNLERRAKSARQMSSPSSSRILRHQLADGSPAAENTTERPSS